MRDGRCKPKHRVPSTHKQIKRVEEVLTVVSNNQPLSKPPTSDPPIKPIKAPVLVSYFRLFVELLNVHAHPMPEFENKSTNISAHM